MADLWLPGKHDVTVTISDGKVYVDETVQMEQRPVGKVIGYEPAGPPPPELRKPKPKP